MELEINQNLPLPEQCQYHQQGLKHQEEIIEFEQLKLGLDIHVYDVEYQNRFGQQWIHTYEAGFENQNTVVLVHGFGGSSITMIQLLQHLKKSLRVYCIDMPGMGLSSRQNFNMKDPEQVIAYFIEGIEEWRKMLNIKEFTLIGHSFGGYMSAMYYNQYEKNLKKLILLSPLGLRQGTPQENQETHDNIIENSGFIRRTFYQQIYGYIQENKTFSQIYQGTFFPSGLVLNRYLSQRMRLPDNQQQLWQNYLDSILNQQYSSESALYELYYFPTLIAQIPIGKVLQEQKSRIDVEFYYGQADMDWMRSKQAEEMIIKQKIQGKFLRVNDAGHQLPIENPELLASMLISNM